MKLLNPAEMELLVRSLIPFLSPSVNSYLKHYKGITYKTREARQWQEAAALILRRDLGRKKPPYEGKVYVEVLVFSKKIKTFDADNRLKTAQDAIQMAGVIKDDRQVMRSAIEKIYSDDEERTIIEVWKYKE